MATIVDTSLYKLNKNAFAILSGAYSKLPELAIEALDAHGSPMQPVIEAQMIQVGALADQITEHVIFNSTGTAIIGIKNEDVSMINSLLMCLRDVAELGLTNTMPSPIVPIDNDSECCAYDVGQIGSILVSDGTKYIPVSPTDVGQVPIWDGTRVIWGASGGNGIPAGGLADQFLRKTSNVSYAATWQTLTIGMVSDITSNAAELNSLDGLNTGAIGAPQFNTLAGIRTDVTIQQQFDQTMSAVLNDGQFFVGNGGNVATPVTPTGDVVFDNTGVFAIQPGVIVDADISPTAAIDRTKLAPGSSWRLVINGGDGLMTAAAAITPDRALISNANGIPIASATSAQALSYIATLGSDAQEQLNNKLTVNAPSPEMGDILKYNGTEWINYNIGAAGTALISTGVDAIWGPMAGNGLPAGGLAHEFLWKASDDNYDSEWHTLLLEDISDLSVTAEELNLLSGLTVGAAEINWLEDLDGNVQDQLDTKMTNSLGYHNLWVGGPGDTAQQLPPGPNGSVLKIIGTSPQWALPPVPGNVTGPVTSTDNAVVRFNGTTGDAIQDSLAILDDTGNMFGLASITLNEEGVLYFGDADDSNFVGISASAAMAADYLITLPADAPTGGDGLIFDGVNYIWAPAGGAGASAFIDLTDVPTTYVGSAGFMVVVNVDEDGLNFIEATAGVGGVNGTPNRITSSGGTTPAIDISPLYVGQASITTLGTVTTGTWQATPVGLPYGGTGSALAAPAADRIMFYDFSGTAVDWLTVGAGLSISGTTLTSTGSYDNEMAQDAVGGILTDTATIAFTYIDDPTGTITANVRTNSITATQFRQSAALSVVGNPTNVLANVSDIAAATDHQVLRRLGTTIGFGAVNLSSTDAVTGALSITNGGTGGTAFTFLALTDTPDTYVSQAGKFLVVNGTSNGIEFVPYVVPPYFLAKEVPAGAIDGVNTTFTLSFTPSPGSESVYVNGDLLEAGVLSDYTISGAVITMAVAPEVGDKFVVIFGGSSGWIGITDGIKGDITVSGTGSVWTINNDAVTFAKMQNINQSSILGRASSGVGDIEQLSGAQANTILPTFTYTLKGLVPAPTGSGNTRYLREDQTWAVPAGGGGGGLPPDGNYGDIAVSGTGTTWTVRPDTITYSKIQNGTALSVLGNGTGVAADLADIVAGTDAHVLRRAGTTLGFGQVASGGIADGAVTYSKMQSATNLSVLGRSDNSVGTMAPIVASAEFRVLQLRSGVLQFNLLTGDNFVGGSIPYDKIQNVTSSKILGRVSLTGGPMEELSGTQVNTLLPTFTTALKGLVPGPATSTGTKFLRDDATWQLLSVAASGVNTELQLNNSGSFGGAGLFSPTPGNLDFGDIAIAGGHTIRTLSSDFNSPLNIILQGQTEVKITNTGALGGILLQPTGTIVVGDSLSRGIIRAGDNLGSTGGDLLLDSGNGSSSANHGSIALFTRSEPNFRGGAKILHWGNATVIPNALPSNGLFLYAEGGQLFSRDGNNYVKNLSGLPNVQFLSSNTTLNATHEIVKITTPGITVAIPSGSGLLGKIYYIKNHSGGNATIDPANLIDGSGLNITLANLDSLTIFSDGSDWFKV